MIIRDLLRRNELVQIAETIGSEIMTIYTVEHDKAYQNSGAAHGNPVRGAEKKLERKLESAIAGAIKTFSVTVTRKKLGIYGKSKVCKELQDFLVKHAYSSDTAVYIINRLLLFSGPKSNAS